MLTITVRILKIASLVLLLVGIALYFNIGTHLYQKKRSQDRSIDRESDLKRLQAAYDDVDTALLFIGYPRSRHTIVSAILDAHPNIMLSNEMNLIGTYGKHPELSKMDMFDKITALSYHLATKGRRSWTIEGNATYYVKTGYKVPNQWQGTFDGKLKLKFGNDAKYCACLKVVNMEISLEIKPFGNIIVKILGDKVGWFTARYLAMESGRSLLKQIEADYNLKAKFIHVIRNPFDNIATMAMRLVGLRTGQHTEKHDISKQLDSSIKRYFVIARNCQETKDVFGDRVLDIIGEDFVRDPSRYLRKMCDFLEITCSEDYLRDCSSIVDPVPSMTRYFLVWTPEQIEKVYTSMQSIEFLQKQSYKF